MEAPAELGLALGEVERGSVHLGGRGDEEDDERHDPEAQHVPLPQARAWEATIARVERLWDSRTTMMTVRPRAAS